MKAQPAPQTTRPLLSSPALAPPVSQVAKLDAALSAERLERRELEDELRGLRATARAQGVELLRKESEGDRHTGPALLAAKHGELQVRF